MRTINQHHTKRLSVHLVRATALALFSLAASGAELPDILQEDTHYLPDFSYAGYAFGEASPNAEPDETLSVTDFGAIPDDGRDDSKALTKALTAANEVKGSVAIELPPGRFIVSDILYLERSHLVLRGAGSGATELYFPRPMMYLPDPPALKELREYLIQLDKRQREKANNIDLPFSQYSWAGGYLWARVPGERVKAYLDDYHQPQNVLTQAVAGKRGQHWLDVASTAQLEVGDVVRINWHNKDGEDGPLLDALYHGADVVIGSHHWTQPEQPLITQQVQITDVRDNKIRIKDTLLHDADASGRPADIATWPHLEEVGIERLSLTFPRAPTVAHHVEPGYNGIYLTRVFNGWVRDLHIHNADSGILTEEVANVTVENVTTTGENLAHYSVAMGDTHNVLVRNLQVHNPVRHPLSFNTFSTRSVYTGSRVFTDPVLDQHSGANHQNLFDNIQVQVSLTPEQREENRYPLFKGGGAGYWKPTHGAFNSFWNIQVQVDSGFDAETPLTLFGVEDGPAARLIGIHGNRTFEIDYGPDAYIEGVNHFYPTVPSLYHYQQQQRLENP